MRRARRERRFARDEEVLAALATADPERDRVLLDRIRVAVAELPPDHREAFLLKHVEELEYEEMAEVTGAGVSALKMRVKRACERLREQLGGLIDA